MLKLEKNMKFRQLPKHLQEHLVFIPTFVIKQIVAVFTFILLDLIIVMPLIFPYVEAILYITVPFIIFINIWAFIFLFKDPLKTEFESLLFLGSLGAVGSFCYFVLIQKMNFFVLNIKSPLLIGVSVITYLLLIAMFIYLREKNTSLSEEKNDSSKEKFNNLNLLKWSVPAGYIITQVLLNQAPQIASSFMVVMYSFIMLYFTDMSVKFFHRYLFMKNNLHLVTVTKFKKGKEISN